MKSVSVHKHGVVALLPALLLLGSVDSLVGQEADDRHQTFELGGGPPGAVTIAYIRVFEDSDFRGGVRLTYSFEENTTTFDHNVWEVFGVDVFGRRVFNPESHMDIGLSLLWFAPEDDTDDAGTFAGAFGGAYFGYKYVFAGIELRAGATTLYDEIELGLILSPRLKVQANL